MPLDLSDNALRAMHALIIEDDPIVAFLIEEALRELGFSTFSFAVDEPQAIEAASRRCPDLITADVELADDCCGIEAVQRICHEKPIPVLYITGSAFAVHERCPEAAVVEKPFRLAELQQGVELARKAA